MRWSGTEGLSGSLPPFIGSMVIDALDVAGLAAFAKDQVTTTRVRRVRIQVLAWRAPSPGWAGRLGPIVGVTRADVRMPYIGPGRVRIRIELTNARPIREVISAALDVLLPSEPIPWTHSVSVASNGALPSWVPVNADVASHFLGSPLLRAVDGSPLDAVSGIKRDPEGPAPNRPAADAELVMEGASPEGFGVAPIRPVSVTQHGIVVEGVAPGRVLLDVRGRGMRRWVAPAMAGAHGRIQVRMTDNGPRWRLATGSVTTGSVTTGGQGAADGPGHARVGPWMGMDASLRASDELEPFSCWYITCDVAAEVPSAAAADLVARLALSGVVLDGSSLPAVIRAQLAEELAAVLCEPLPDAQAEALVWESRSVRQRRAVVRGHATSLMIDAGIRPSAVVQIAPPTVTALLITRRARLAAFALRMMRDQTYPRLDVIVGLHGVAAVPELRDEAAGAPFPVEIMELPGTGTLGEALGIATGRARGSFVAKVDDDDVYGPEHVWDLVVARALSGATVVGKGGEFVLLDQLGITVRRENMGSDGFNRVVAGGTIMVPRGDLESLGGWRPVPSGVDRAFLDRVLQGGGSIYRTWPIGFIYRRHGIGHTWELSDDYFLRGAGAQWQGVPDLPEFGTQHVGDVADMFDDPG